MKPPMRIAFTHIPDAGIEGIEGIEDSDILTQADGGA